jgi:hypothetical protein
MNLAAPCLAGVITGLLACAGCDRNSEAATIDERHTNEQPAVAASATTITAVGVIPTDGGSDAGATLVGVSVTTIATHGHPTVVESIARARCDREFRCGNVADDKTFATTEQCLSSVASAWRDDLNRYECPGGIDQEELDECMREIRNEDCRNPFDSLERLVACRSSDICIATR